MWRSAGNVPRSEGGRPLAHIAVNGHGSYPIAGTIPRIFFAANDQTSNQGAVWDTVRSPPDSSSQKHYPCLRPEFGMNCNPGDCKRLSALLVFVETSAAWVSVRRTTITFSMRSFQ